MVAEQGYEKVTVRDLAQVAGVSTRTFYKHFANTEECFADAYESSMRRAFEKGLAAGASRKDRDGRIRAGIGGFLEAIAARPRAAQLALVDVFGTGPKVHGQVSEAMRCCEDLLNAEIASGSRRQTAPRHLVAGIVAGVTRVARRTTMTGKAGDLPKLREPLGDWVLSLADVDQATLKANLRGLMSRSKPVQRSQAEFADPRPHDPYGRILKATAKLSVSIGYPALTVSKIRTEAGVSRRTFDSYFDSVEACFLAALTTIVAEAAVKAELSATEAQSWEGAIYRQMVSLSEQMVASPSFSQLVLAGVLTPGRGGLVERERLIDCGALQLRLEIPSSHHPNAIGSEASVAAAWRIAQGAAARGRVEDLPHLAPLITYLFLAPVVGSARAIEAMELESESMFYGEPALGSARR